MKRNLPSRPSPWSSLVLVLFLIVCSVFLITWTRLEIISLGYRIGERAKFERELHETNKALRIKVAGLRSPARLQRLARERFGLVPPPADQVVLISTSRKHDSAKE